MRTKAPSIALVLVLLMVGCRQQASKPPALAEAQRLYAKTKWYWAKTVAMATNLSGFSITAPANSSQILMRSQTGTSIIYTEFTPGGGFMGWYGKGRLAECLRYD